MEVVDLRLVAISLSSDGSIGAWAAQWVKEWGVVVRGIYGTLDVTHYDEPTCRYLGDEGIPADVEAIARVHPITEVAQLTTENGPVGSFRRWQGCACVLFARIYTTP